MFKAWRSTRATVAVTIFAALSHAATRGDVAADPVAEVVGAEEPNVGEIAFDAVAPEPAFDVVGTEEPAGEDIKPVATEAIPVAEVVSADQPSTEQPSAAQPVADDAAPEPIETGSILLESMPDVPEIEGLLEHAPHEIAGSCSDCTAGGCTGGCERSPSGIGETYWIFDSVFLQRDNQSTDQILAAIGPNAIITTGQPQFAVQPGLRLFRGVVDDCGRGWELGYLGVWNMFADLDEGGRNDINGGDPLSFLVDGFDGRSLARATYS